MKESTRNFLVGLLSSLGLVALAGLLMSFGELDFLFHHRYDVTIYTDNAAGLREGSGVEYHGVPVGLVKSVSATDDPAAPVKIVASIDKKTRLPADVKPYASTQLIGGTAVLQFRSPTKEPTQWLPEDGSAAITAPMRGGMFQDLNEQLDARLQPLMDSLERFNKLSDTFVSLGENLNNLLVPQSAEQVRNGEQPNLRTAIVKLNAVLDQAQHGLELATSFLGDDVVQSDARHAIQQASMLIDQATAAVDHYVQLAQALKTDANEFTQRVLPVMDTLGATLEEFRRVTRAASEGKGTMGQLLNNPDLYNSLTDATTRLNRTLTELQVLIQQMRAEGVIIKF